MSDAKSFEKKRLQTLFEGVDQKQQVVSASIAESELYAAAKTASDGDSEIQSVARDLAISC